MQWNTRQLMFGIYGQLFPFDICDRDHLHAGLALGAGGLGAKLHADVEIGDTLKGGFGDRLHQGFVTDAIAFFRGDVVTSIWLPAGLPSRASFPGR